MRKHAKKELKYEPPWSGEVSADELTTIIRELHTHQVELETQNERFRTAQAELEKSRSRYADLYDFAPIGYFVFDRNGQILDLNMTGARLLGLERKNLVRASFNLFVARPDRNRFHLYREEIFETGKRQSCELRLITKDGREFYGRLDSRAVKNADGKSSQCRTAISDVTERIVRDIAERKDMEACQQLAGQILECLNRKSAAVDLIRDVLKLIKKAIAFDAVGIRQRAGKDFPYLEVDGFSNDFVKTENHLCCHDEAGELIYDSQGRPAMACLCGNVLSGRTDPTLPFFSEGGSFWTNSTTELLACAPPEALQAPVRNRCNEAGYESVALIPLRSGDEIVGLLQLNDTRRERFTPKMISFFEGIGTSIGIGMARIQAEADLMKHRHHLEELVRTRTAELTQANKKLRQEIEERKRLEKEILEISERERRRFGQELHDSLGQQLAGVSFLTKVVEKKLAARSAEETPNVAEITKLVKQAIDQARNLARGMHPVGLEEGGLMTSLQELAGRMQKLFHVHCTFKHDKSIEVADPSMAVHLYRITQEAITNAIKHGKTKNIQVELARQGDESVLTVKNDGLDFPADFEARGPGMGLQIMDHRADIIGATLDIHKAAGGGTIMTCSFLNRTR